MKYNVKNGLAFDCCLLDRDGTLIFDKHYLSDPDGVELLPNVGETLAWLSQQGVALYLVSNQSGVGRGLFTHDDVNACNKRLQTLLAPYGVQLKDMVYCPHTPEKACSCRKPGIGMWKELESRYTLVGQRAIMIGDKRDDLFFASNCGLLFSVLLCTGKGQAVADSLLHTTLQQKIFIDFTERRAGYPAIIAQDWFALECAFKQSSDVLMGFQE